MQLCSHLSHKVQHLTAALDHKLNAGAEHFNANYSFTFTN